MAAKNADDSAKESKTTKKAAAKKPAAKKAAAKKPAAKKAAAKKPAAKKAAAKKPAAKKAAAKAESHFTKEFLEQQKEKLHSERERYMTSARTWKAEADSLIENREPGDVQFDEESGEGDSLAVERERDLALSSYARAAVDEIDDALERLEKGTYGICVTSGLPIPEERLEAIPWAAERVEVKAAGFGY